MNIERQTSNVEKKTKTRARISLEELRETQRWLKLIQRVPELNSAALRNWNIGMLE